MAGFHQLQFNPIATPDASTSAQGAHAGPSTSAQGARGFANLGLPPNLPTVIYEQGNNNKLPKPQTVEEIKNIFCSLAPQKLNNLLKKLLTGVMNKLQECANGNGTFERISHVNGERRAHIKEDLFAISGFICRMIREEEILNSDNFAFILLCLTNTLLSKIDNKNQQDLQITLLQQIMLKMIYLSNISAVQGHPFYPTGLNSLADYRRRNYQFLYPRFANIHFVLECLGNFFDMTTNQIDISQIDADNKTNLKNALPYAINFVIAAQMKGTCFTTNDQNETNETNMLQFFGRFFEQYPNVKDAFAPLLATLTNTQKALEGV